MCGGLGVRPSRLWSRPACPSNAFPKEGDQPAPDPSPRTTAELENAGRAPGALQGGRELLHGERAGQGPRTPPGSPAQALRPQRLSGFCGNLVCSLHDCRGWDGSRRPGCPSGQRGGRFYHRQVLCAFCNVLRPGPLRADDGTPAALDGGIPQDSSAQEVPPPYTASGRVDITRDLRLFREPATAQNAEIGRAHV